MRRNSHASRWGLVTAPFDLAPLLPYSTERRFRSYGDAPELVYRTASGPVSRSAMSAPRPSPLHPYPMLTQLKPLIGRLVPVAVFLPVLLHAAGCSQRDAAPEASGIADICADGGLPCVSTHGLAGVAVLLSRQLLCSGEIRALADGVGCSAEFEAAAGCSRKNGPRCTSETELVQGSCTAELRSLKRCIAANSDDRCAAEYSACGRCACEACACDDACTSALAERDRCDAACESEEEGDSCFRACDEAASSAVGVFQSCVGEAFVAQCQSECSQPKE